MIQDLNDVKNYKVLFETQDGQCRITNIYDGIKNEKISTVILILNDYVMVEIDINKQDFINESLITNFIFKNKADPKNKFLKFEVGDVYSYSVFLSFDDSRNPKAIWKFNEKIVCLKLRPKAAVNLNTTQNTTGNHIAISYDNNKLKVFHFETKALVAEFQSHFGNIISINYSDDGKLLAAGTESDNIFIINAEFNKVIFCLEGHKNYVTSVLFEEIKFDEGDMSTLDMGKSEYTSLNKNTMVVKELNLDDFSKLVLNDDSTGDLDVKKLRRNRTTGRNSICIEEEYKEITVYDVYTSSLDGQIGIWRVEFFHNDEVNPKNYFSYPLNKDSSQLIKVDKPASDYLTPSPDIKLYHSSMAKFQNSPINHLFKFENLFVYLAKRNTSGSSVYLRFYLGNMKVIDVEEAKRRGKSGRAGSTSQSPVKRHISAISNSDSIKLQNPVRGKSVQKSTK
jgi:hypothetical protein